MAVEIEMLVHREWIHYNRDKASFDLQVWPCLGLGPFDRDYLL